jgi:uncharacterized protein YodC (DUF2158 family)
MSTDQLQSGDTVKLKSGGPIMTFTSYGGRGGYPTHFHLCYWFVDEEIHESSFPDDALVKVDPSDFPDPLQVF